jgi:DNA-binding CsgD family transcriptional regulator
MGSDISRLTPREAEVLKLIAAGLSTKQIALSLNISFKTAACHRARLMDKLEIHEVAGLTRYAIRNGYINGVEASNPHEELEQLFQQVRVTHIQYKQAMDAYAIFQKDRESIGLANPDSSTGARRLRDAEALAHTEYHAALVALRKFLIPDAS